MCIIFYIYTKSKYMHCFYLFWPHGLAFYRSVWSEVLIISLNFSWLNHPITIGASSGKILFTGSEKTLICTCTGQYLSQLGDPAVVSWIMYFKLVQCSKLKIVVIDHIFISPCLFYHLFSFSSTLTFWPVEWSELKEKQQSYKVDQWTGQGHIFIQWRDSA